MKMGTSASIVNDGESPQSELPEGYDPSVPLPYSHTILDKAMLENIRLIEFDDFLELGTFPRYPQCRNIAKPLSTFTVEEYHKSLIIFISHCWLRGWSGAEGWDGRPHPDNANGDKFKLCIEGIKFIRTNMAPGMEKCYVWLDFGCIDQDGNPAGELKMLDKIVQISDCIFTPVYDANVDSWKLPDQISDMYTEYASPAWVGHPYSYLNRCWCRIEMFYAANIPLFNPPPLMLTNGEGDEACEIPPRHTKFAQGFAFHMKEGRRPHILYGSLEQRGYSPFIMPPLQNSSFERFHPEKGFLSVESDRLVIKQLVEDIRPYMKQLKGGYIGEVNDEGKQHGRGREINDAGEIYEGTFENGLRHGYGKYVYPDGDHYEGGFKEGVYHGKGKFVFGNGAYYDGDWVDGLKQGFGFYDYTEGSTYEGEWFGDNPNGRGKMVYADGSVYEGDFVEDLRHGYGKLIQTDGELLEGQWKDDVLVESI
jgi:hypothetical protein